MADTIVKLFLENAERNPKAPALLDIRGTYSYEEMNRRSAYLAEKILVRRRGEAGCRAASPDQGFHRGDVCDSAGRRRGGAH